jgi:hypothetical protein
MRKNDGRWLGISPLLKDKETHAKAPRRKGFCTRLRLISLRLGVRHFSGGAIEG